ncbi:hypothetical protein K7I13_02325 [Brucepastera parasyntrophica]|uniref:hypothetical protein n=1 Tax=Brucepastera parasyntrophica TaxID=2880008 RepID=UPI00210E465B|nr:hypothetical protein [Brucepastera parasyntrophica]ULQ60176.1 hypothetical protein K7I13_02325 [Brucepastera parasyntrophica]
MLIREYHIVYPEGETQEIHHELRVNDVVDANGQPYRLPLPTNKLLAYQVYRKRVSESRGMIVTWFYLAQLSAEELLEYV